MEERLRTELSELRSMLETRNSEFRLVEKRQQELEEEIAAARELSAMHDRLRVELEVRTLCPSSATVLFN